MPAHPAQSSRGARIRAIVLWTNAVVAIGLMLAFVLVLPTPADAAGGPGLSLVERVLFSTVFLLLVGGLAVMGALVAVHRPRNPIGWLFAASALAMAVPDAAGGYAALSVTQHAGTLPGTAFLAWLSSWPFVFVITMLLIYVPLLFPTGHLPSPRWRPVAALGVIGPLPPILAAILTPGPIQGYPGVSNPFGIEGIGRALDVAVTISNTLAAPIFLLVVFSVVQRYRHGSLIERQQIKWFAYVLAIAAVAFIISLPNSGPIADAAWEIGLSALAMMPIAVGVAILRYRLFDIDQLINRTLVYVALTALLIGLELGGILVLRTVLQPFTGETSIAVAATTLGVAALFQPLRQRIQQVVDRRFYRSRYDAVRVVAGFSSRLRDEVSLDRLTDDLGSSVAEALKPASVSVWLRPRSANR